MIMEKISCTERGDCFVDGVEFTHLRSLGDGIAIECIKRDSLCKYSFMFGETMYCSCPLIRYLYDTQKSAPTNEKNIIAKGHEHRVKIHH